MWTCMRKWKWDVGVDRVHVDSIDADLQVLGSNGAKQRGDFSASLPSPGQSVDW